MKTETLWAVEGNCFSGSSVGHRAVLYREDRVTSEGRPDAVWHLADDEILLPSFHDHHCHLVREFAPPRGPALHQSPSRSAALDEVRRWLLEHPGTAPVLGVGWDESAWEDGPRLCRADLDAIDPQRPIALRRVCGHLAVLNSGAWSDLKPAGAEADPAEGIIIESLALNLPHRWPVAFGDAVEGAVNGFQEAVRLGVGGIDEMGDFETHEVLDHLRKEGRLLLNVRHYLPLERFEEFSDHGIFPGAGEGRLRVIGCKGFLDGSFGVRTAALTTPYENSDDAGVLLWETRRLTETVRRASRVGYSIALHAIGRRAVEQALQVYEEVGRPSPGRLHRIEHAEQVDETLMERGTAAGVVWSMQPNFTVRWQNSGGMYERLLGRARARDLNRYRSISRSGRLLFGSDTMPMGPLFGLVGCLEHPVPRERLGVSEALRAYMRDGLGEEATEDLLSAGEAADLTVLKLGGEDLGHTLRTGNARVVWTATGGRTAWCDDSATAPPAFREQTT